MASTLTLLHLGLRAWVWGAARVEAQQSARYAVERLAGELREAGYDPTGAGIAPVVLAEPTRVVFQRDFNGNGVVDPTHERVTYLLRPGESILRRDAGGGAQPVVEAATTLEEMGRGHRLEEVEQVLRTLDLALAALRPELESL